tara:strand:- start:9 stop:440 length:432 start_codon:yes stop_codon:yes gene_type:complete
MTLDYSSAWYTTTPYSVNGSATPTPDSGVKIISGRTRVHGVWVMNGNSVSYADTELTLTRPISLLDSSGGNVLYKAAFNNPTTQASTSIYAIPACFYTHYFGGNGILFEDGVWFAIDLYDQTEDTAYDTAKYVAVLYTGGANT